jgi:ribosomal protein S18 acetylase RimI-like enzyme
MTSVPLQARSVTNRYVRPLNVLRDLPRVADLIELCFATNMDSEGQSYVRQMRRASRDSSFLKWANSAFESASLPLSGFVWEQDGRIIGNASLVPFRHNGKRIYLVANVATHPEYRRQGIASILTERTMKLARQRGADGLWLHVRTDNPGAIQMYADLGFVERARRTTWRTSKGGIRNGFPSYASDSDASGLPIVTKRYAHFWSQQLAWLNQLHPESLNWYRSINWKRLRPGPWNWFYRLFIEFDLQQWAVLKKGRLQGVLAWLPATHNASLWLACDPEADTESITSLLQMARHSLTYRQSLVLEHPAGLQEQALLAAGFNVYRTLIWMRSEGAT